MAAIRQPSVARVPRAQAARANESRPSDRIEPDSTSRAAGGGCCGKCRSSVARKEFFSTSRARRRCRGEFARARISNSGGHGHRLSPLRQGKYKDNGMATKIVEQTTKNVKLWMGNAWENAVLNLKFENNRGSSPTSTDRGRILNHQAILQKEFPPSRNGCVCVCCLHVEQRSCPNNIYGMDQPAAQNRSRLEVGLRPSPKYTC